MRSWGSCPYDDISGSWEDKEALARTPAVYGHEMPSSRLWWSKKSFSRCWLGAGATLLDLLPSCEQNEVLLFMYYPVCCFVVTTENGLRHLRYQIFMRWEECLRKMVSDKPPQEGKNEKKIWKSTVRSSSHLLTFPSFPRNKRIQLLLRKPFGKAQHMWTSFKPDYEPNSDIIHLCSLWDVGAQFCDGNQSNVQSQRRYNSLHLDMKYVLKVFLPLWMFNQPAESRC